MEDFRLGPALGAGLTGTYVLATREGRHQQVALKLCHPHRASLRPAAERLTRALDPRLVHYEALGERGDGWSGWFAACTLQPLDHAVARETTSLAQRLQFVRRTAEAVAVLHGAGVVHGDLRPSNVLIRRLRSGAIEPLITDVGVVPRYDPDFHDAPSRARALYPYLAPEAILDFRGGGNAAPTEAGDVYGLGALLCELVCGQAPGTAESERLPGEILAAKERRRYFLAALLDPESPVDPGVVNRLLERALDPDPAQRPTAIRFADAVQASLSRNQTALP